MNNSDTEGKKKKKVDYNTIGMSLANYGRHKEAIEKFKKAIEAKPDDWLLTFSTHLP